MQTTAPITDEKCSANAHGQYPLAAWMALRNAYVTGQGSLPDLCPKHGINLRSAEERCAKEKWRTKRAMWRERQEAKFEEGLETPEQPAPRIEPEPGVSTQNPGESVPSRAQKIEKLIAQTEAAYEHADSPRDMQACAMALDRLYGTWSLLTGHERPGVRKPSHRSKPEAPSFDNLEAK